MSATEHCPNMTGCPLFPHFNHEGTLRVWMINYCEGDYSKCQRYQLSQRGERPDDHLLPNGSRLPTLS